MHITLGALRRKTSNATFKMAVRRGSDNDKIGSWPSQFMVRREANR